VTDPLFVQPDGVRAYAQIHDEVVAGLSQLMGAAAPEAAGVQTSHGAIASAVSTALDGVLGARQGTMQATSTSGRTISELLHKAAQMYEHSDQKGAETLRAAAAVGQMAQSTAPPLQGIAQGLQQVQGVAQLGAGAGPSGIAPTGTGQGPNSTGGRAPETPRAERPQTRPQSD
jgi:Excreted virulence factor EspC, type VII ESX diderm